MLFLFENKKNIVKFFLIILEEVFLKDENHCLVVVKKMKSDIKILSLEWGKSDMLIISHNYETNQRGVK